MELDLLCAWAFAFEPQVLGQQRRLKWASDESFFDVAAEHPRPHPGAASAHERWTC